MGFNKHRSYIKFVIIATHRTGSNYLSCLLNDHPEVFSLGEVFNLPTIWGQPGNPEINHSRILKIFRNLLPVSFLRLYVYGKYPDLVKAVGFRYFYSQADTFQSVTDYLRSQSDVKVIHLKRRNLLDSYVSLNLAKSSGVWSSEKPPGKLRKLVINPKDCLDYFEKSSRLITKYDRLFAKSSRIDIYYEDLLRKKASQIRKILKYLGILDRKLTCNLIKQNTRSFDEVVVNYKILKKYFRGTRWEGFFN